MKSAIKKLTPKWLLNVYHFLFAVLANLVYSAPSRKILVIGITGTKGKTSSANFIWSVLQSGGIKTGIISTANIRIGEKEEENNFHMTMPGRFFIQKTLSRIVKAGCEVAVVETTSQGILQYRHFGVGYDVCIFTNLTPEHIDAHGNFEEYKRIKGKMFEAMSKYKKKKWRGSEFPKTILANADDQHADFYLGFKSDRKNTFSIEKISDFKAEDTLLGESGSTFRVNGNEYKIALPGMFNIYNALPAIAIGSIFGVQQENIKTGLKAIKSIRGRMDEVANYKGFRVFVDYAHEPAGLQAVIETANMLKSAGARSIVLIGAPGGGRYKGKIKVTGQVGGKFADIVVVSDDEPYEDDPTEILNLIKEGAIESGKIENKNLFVVQDRREGIKKALDLAKPGDVVIFTGLGHQNVRMVGKASIPWIEKEIVSNLLNSI